MKSSGSFVSVSPVWEMLLSIVGAVLGTEVQCAPCRSVYCGKEDRHNTVHPDLLTSYRDTVFRLGDTTVDR